MHKESTGQTMSQVMTPFQQQFGKPCLCRATLSLWEKKFSFQVNVHFPAAPYLEMFFGAKLNPHYMLEM